MSYKAVFKEKLSKMIFLEINKEGFLEAISNGENIKLKNNDLYLPIDVDYISGNIKNQNKMNNIPIYKFVEGMLFALGCDEDFKYNDDYEKLLNKISESLNFGKKIIAEKINENMYDDAFILLKGLLKIKKEIEFYEKIFLIGEYIRKQDSNFSDQQKNVIDECKEYFPNYPMSYYYNGLILRDEEETFKAFIEMNEYLNKGGEKTEEFILVFNELKDSVEYEKGKELSEEDPKTALEKLLPLLENYGNNPMLFLHIAIAYRNLGNSEKAIYYLNESLSIEDAYVETINELGLNYAMLEDFENAIKYFRKAFEATRNIEICTNLIMCYMHSNNLEEAKRHLEIANKIDPQDEIVIQLNSMLENK